MTKMEERKIRATINEFVKFLKDDENLLERDEAIDLYARANVLQWVLMIAKKWTEEDTIAVEKDDEIIFELYNI